MPSVIITLSNNPMTFSVCIKRGHLTQKRIKFHAVYRGAFCQFLFWWIYYSSSSKSTGKKTGKMHLCAVVQKCHFGNFSKGAWMAVPCQYRPSKINHNISKFLFVSSSHEYLKRREDKYLNLLGQIF